MHKRMNNMLEAAQPAPPTVADFLTVLRGVIDPQAATGASFFSALVEKSPIRIVSPLFWKTHQFVSYLHLVNTGGNYQCTARGGRALR